MKWFALLATLSFASFALADIAVPKPEPFVAPVVAAPEVPAVTPTPSPAPLHPQGIEKAMPSMGVIDGGWAYVYACYFLAIGGTFFYGLSLFLRRPTGPLPGAQS